MILTQTPYRVSLFGGGTDYPAYYRGRGGMVVGFAIQKYCYLAAKRTPIGQDHRYRVVDSEVDTVTIIDQIRHPGARGVLRYLKVTAPTEITYFGDLPSGGGMGASSAYVVGLLQALRVLEGHRRLVPQELAYDATYVERMIIGEAVGDQDQLFASYGGIRSFDFGDGGGVTPKLLDPPGGVLADELEETAVLVWTGRRRYAHEMAAKVIAAVPEKLMLLSEMHQLAIAARDLIMRGAGVAALIPLLVENWELKRRIHTEISAPDIDFLYAKGLQMGAAAGKLLGAGGGGFLLFLVPAERKPSFMAEMTAGGHPCTSIAVSDSGCTVMVDSL